MARSLFLLGSVLPIALACVACSAPSDRGADGSPAPAAGAGDNSSVDALASGPTTTVDRAAQTLGLGGRVSAAHEPGRMVYTYDNGSIVLDTIAGKIATVTARGVDVEPGVVDLALGLDAGTFLLRVPEKDHSVSYSFASGAVFRWDPTAGALAGAQLRVDDQPTPVPASVVAAASASSLGALVSADPGSFAFERGTVAYNDRTESITDVTLAGGAIAPAVRVAAASFRFGPAKGSTHERGFDHVSYNGGHVDYDTVQGKVTVVGFDGIGDTPAAVAGVAASLSFGRLVSETGPGSAPEFAFANGATIGWDATGGHVTSVRPPSSDLPLDVALVAAHDALGTLVSVDPGTPEAHTTSIGSTSAAVSPSVFTFSLGVVTYSSSLAKVIDVAPR